MNAKCRLQPQEELQFIKFLMDRAADAIFVVDADTQLLYVNDAACCMTGYSGEELLAMTMQDVNPVFEVEVWSEYWKIVKQQGFLYVESQHLTKSGDFFPVDFTLTYLEYHGKECCCIFIRDLTKRQQLEVAAHKANEVVNYSIKERTTQLKAANQELCRQIAKLQQTEVEIRQALEKEKELSEVRAGFCSMVSHELRTPLNIISFSASLLKRHISQWSQEKKISYLHRIQTAVEQLSQLMDEVLIIGRAEAGKLKFEPKPLDLEQLCRNLVGDLQRNDSSQHTITFVTQGEGSVVCVDDKLLQPILTNLLLNAIKYSAKGSTIVLVLSYQNGEVILQIKDRGIGIPVADQQRLFEPFHRGSNVGDIPGTGLGLAVVKKLLDIHGGQISVESKVRLGTTFTIKLPLNQTVEAGECTPLIFPPFRQLDN